MELMQLEMFAAVVEERSIQKAAGRVLRTQPAVSLALAKLEREIGARLIDRSRQLGCRPTAAGELLYEYASRMIGLRNEARSMLREESSSGGGQLRIGVSGGATLRWVSRLASEFGERNQNVRVEVLCDSTEKLLHELADRTLDLVLLPARPQDDGMRGDVVMAPIGGPAGEQQLWSVQRRVGRSHVAKSFEEMMNSSSTGAAGRAGRARAKKREVHRGKLRVAIPRLSREE